MNWEKVLDREHCRHDGHVLKIDFRFLLDQGPQCDRFAQLTLLTADGWRIIKEVQYNDYDRRWTPNKEHAVLALKAYAAFLFAPQEYPAAYQAFKSEFKGAGATSEHRVWNDLLPATDEHSDRFFATCADEAANSYSLLQAPTKGAMSGASSRAWKRWLYRNLAVLLDLPVETPRDEVWQAYRQARVKKLGLPPDTCEEDLMRAEFLNPDKRLTIDKLEQRYDELARLRLRNVNPDRQEKECTQ